MDIKLTPVKSKEKARAAVDKAKRELKKSNWHRIFTHPVDQIQKNEAASMLEREEYHIAQLEDIANHAPDMPTLEVWAYNSYRDRQTLKSNGFRFSGPDKAWYRSVAVDEFDNLLDAIGASIDDAEKLLAGLS